MDKSTLSLCPMTSDERLAWLQDRVGKLKKLLDEPQTGLSTWAKVYGDLMAELTNFWLGKTVLLWVYDDNDSAPWVIHNPPDNLPDLLRDWNILDRDYCTEPKDAPNWKPVNEWLKDRGVDIIEADEIRLSDFNGDTRLFELA